MNNNKKKGKRKGEKGKDNKKDTISQYVANSRNEVKHMVVDGFARLDLLQLPKGLGAHAVLRVAVRLQRHDQRMVRVLLLRGPAQLERGFVLPLVDHVVDLVHLGDRIAHLVDVAPRVFPDSSLCGGSQANKKQNKKKIEQTK